MLKLRKKTERYFLTANFSQICRGFLFGVGIVCGVNFLGNFLGDWL